MNVITISIGAFLCTYAMVVLVLRLKEKNHLFRKLDAMKKFWGQKLGSGIHYFGYVVLPFVFGIICIVQGIKGVNIFSVFNLL
ncbi:MAG: hypothetical protein OEV78_10260 [Spirochaetia bacterium]|nr:hypothetical protein [Spirochaetia bacterium]